MNSLKNILSLNFLNREQRFGMLISVIIFYCLHFVWSVSLGTSILVFVVATFLSIQYFHLLKNPLKVWDQIGLILGKFFTPIVMGGIYFLVFSPVAIFLRLIGRDLLNLRKKSQNSFWITRDSSSKQNFREPF